MIDPSLPLQKSQYAALTGVGALPAGTGVHDSVPLGSGGKLIADFPFVHLGEDQVTSDADQCHDPSTVHSTIHVFSRKPGKVEAKTIMAAALLVLDTELDIEGFAVIGHLVTDLRHMTDPDGLTSHSAATLRYRLSPTA